MKKLSILLFFIFALNSFTFACDPEPGPQHFPHVRRPPRIQTGYFAVYNKLNGLVSNQILSILPFDTDQANYTVVGTQDKGLMIFDGENWHFSGSDLFTFPETAVPAIARTDKNEFYVGTSRGLYRGRLNVNSINFDLINISSQQIKNILAISPQPGEKNHLFIGSDRFIGSLNESAFQPFNFNDNRNPTGFSCITHTKKGVFTGCNQGLFEIKNKSLYMVPPLEGQEFPGWVNDFSSTNLQVFIAASNGVFLLEKENENELSSFFPGIWATALDYSGPKDVRINRAKNRIFERANTQELTATSQAREQIMENYNQLQADYEAFTNRWAGQETIPQEDVMEMYGRFMSMQQQIDQVYPPDRAIKASLIKGLWIGTQDNGLILYGQDQKKYHMTSENSKLPSDQITTIACRDSGETWIGTSNGGLMRYTKREISNTTALMELFQCNPVKIRIVADMLLVGTKKDGLHMYSTETLESLGHFNKQNTEGFHELVTDFDMDSDGNLWITGDAGVIQWNGKNWQNIGFRNIARTPEVPATNIEIDADNRIFVAFSKADFTYNQIFVYNGSKLEGTDPESIKRLLKLKDKDRVNAIDLHGLSNVYMREFDFKNATDSLTNFETGVNGKVEALLNTEHYLLIGMDNGLQKIFDGQNFKPLSEKGSGKIGAIKNYFMTPTGIIAIQAEMGISEFDGTHYKLLELPLTDGGLKITDMCLDKMNPETYLISYTTTGGGGYARYQNGFWEKCPIPHSVRSLAQIDKRIFLATPEGVYYLKE